MKRLGALAAASPLGGKKDARHGAREAVGQPTRHPSLDRH